MIYTRKQIDYWRVDLYSLTYVYGSWTGTSTHRPNLPGCTINLYEDCIYLHEDQSFLQVL